MSLLEADDHVLGVLLRRADGWRVALEYPDGTVSEQIDPPFPTRELAQAALDKWAAANDIAVLKAQ